MLGADTVRVEFGLSCEYKRQRKKRGKASRKSISQDNASMHPFDPAQAADDQSSEGPTSPTHAVPVQNLQGQPSSGSHDRISTSTISIPPIDQMTAGDYQRASMRDNIADRVLPTGRMDDKHTTRNVTTIPPYPNSHQKLPQMDVGPDFPRELAAASPSTVSLNGFSLSHINDRPHLHGQRPVENRSNNSESYGSQGSGQQAHQSNFQSGNGASYIAPSPRLNQAPSPGFRFGSLGGSPFPSFLNATSPIVGSPGWLNLPSPSAFQQNIHQKSSMSSLRYPVLQPLLPYVESIIPISLACDLLELYFASSSSTHMHPSSPYIIAYVFRKSSFLKTVRPRPCSPALLASMLWLAAQTSDSSFLTSPPSARGRVCQKLMELTVMLLKPLMHGPQTGETSGDGASQSMVNGVALGGLGVAMTGGEQLAAESEGAGPLDIVATYIHLATIVSASEYKAASMRWWNAAWSFAREMRLNRELPANASESEHTRDGDLNIDDGAAGRFRTSTMPLDAVGSPANSLSGFVSEEEREERRRVWWLLFAVDRHLSLCYNQPLTLLDAECENLLQPMDDNDWQAGHWPSGSTDFRLRGPSSLCTGHGMFGFFMPLMTLLGDIIDLNQARAHPRFGQRSRREAAWDEQEAVIRSHLEAYARSLSDFEAQASAAVTTSNDPSSSVQAQPSGERTVSGAAIQAKTVVAYGTHIMHVLHILVTGKWDPINLLDDNDSWISTPSFISAMGHAVSAADAVADILEYDPDLSYMPWVFGISLLQGSFLLLLIADKLGTEADAAVITACEKVVRAHEVCVTTLNTEYQVCSPRWKFADLFITQTERILTNSGSQRHMRKVMRSALAQVKGRVPADFGEQQSRRREVLSLYRWTGDGTGLAL